MGNPLYLDLFQYTEFNGVYFFWFRLVEMAQLGKFGQKKIKAVSLPRNLEKLD